MAEIFKCPKEIKQPKLDFKNIGKYEKDCAEFISELKEFVLKRNPNGKNVGEIIRFPMGDGYAEYMVAGIKPVELIHIPLWDAWDFPYAHKTNAKDIQAQLDGAKAMAKLFGKKD